MGRPSECRHCCRVRPVHRAHRLCVECYQFRDLWDAAPAALPDPEEDKIEEAALEAMIAEQMRPENLPPWWARAVRKQQKRGIARAREEFGRLLWGKRA